MVRDVTVFNGVYCKRNGSEIITNKKVLLRERKRHTARRVAIAIFLLLPGGGGGGPSTKILFPQSEHVSSQICCQKFFPLLRPGTPPGKSETPPPRKI